MKINVLVTGGIYSTQSGYSAIQFCHAAIQAGHIISQVFFYQDGSTQSTQLSVPMGDEFDEVNQWRALAKQSGCELVVCVSAAERRGVISATQADEFEKPSANIHTDFIVAGLGVLHEAMLTSDRMVTFK